MSMQARLDAVIDGAIASSRVVGAAVMVAREGAPIYARAAGFADRESGAPAGIDTIFRFASLTKPIVAATALAMVDRGLLALEGPVTEYLPWFTPALPGGEAPEITIRQLMTHTSGLVYGGEALERAGVQAGLVDGDITLEENLRRLVAVPLLGPPGAQWSYSIGIDVIGGVIAAIEGTTLGEAVARYVTGPAGMADTGFLVTDSRRLATAYANHDPAPIRMSARQYVPKPDGSAGVTFSPERILNPKAYHSGGAGMAGTARDFLRFLEVLRRGGDPIMKPELVNLGASNLIGDLESGPGMGFGLFGAVCRDPAAAGVPWPAGTYEWGGVYGCRWFIDPANGISVVSLTNTAPEGVDGAFPDAVRDAVYPPLDAA